MTSAARPEWAVDVDEYLLGSRDMTVPPPGCVFVSSGLGPTWPTVAANLPVDHLAHLPVEIDTCLTAGEAISARVDLTTNTVWICRETTRRYIGQLTTLQARWYSFAEYLTVPLDHEVPTAPGHMAIGLDPAGTLLHRWSHMEPMDVWTVEQDDGNFDNLCYVKDDHAAQGFTIDEGRVAALWRRECT